MDSFLTELLNHPVLVATLVAFLGILVIALVGVLIILAKRTKKLGPLNFGDKEEPKNDLPSADGEDVANVTKFFSTINQVVNFSIQAGYSNSEKRQHLFDTQMSQIKDNFDMLLTFILESYQARCQGDTSIVRVLIKYSLEKIVLSGLRHICVQDRLAEKTKDAVIEQNRPFISTSYPKVRQELQSLLATVTSEGGKVSFSSKDVLESLDDRKELFKKTIVDSLEFAHDEAVKYLNEVHENNQSFNAKINNALKVYFTDTRVHELMPNTWIEDQSTIPPNSVAGGQ